MYKIGSDLKLRYGSAGSAAVSGTVLDKIKDVNCNPAFDTTDVTTRANSGWKETMLTLGDMTLTFNMPIDSTDANWAALRSAFLSKTPLAFWVEDGSGAVDADFSISSLSLGQPLADAETTDVECKLKSFRGWTSNSTSTSL